MRWIVGIGIVFLVVLLLAGELFLPWVVARGVARSLENTYGVGGDFDVSLSSRPALRMLFGKVDKLTVDNRRVQTATMAIDSIAVTIEDVSVNLQKLLRLQVDSTRGSAMQAVFSISEGNLRAYVLDNVEGLAEPQFKVFDGRAALAGYVKFAGTPVLVAAEGRFVQSGERKVLFVVDTLSIEGEPVPERITEVLLSALGGPELFIDLAGLPMPMVIKEVKMRDGWLIIEAATPVR